MTEPRAISVHLFDQPQAEVELPLTVVRNFSTWFFDLLRNFVLVGGLKYFAEKSGSVVLFLFARSSRFS